MEKLKAGMKFNEVAATYSEDKARSGVSNHWAGWLTYYRSECVTKKI
jgi:hypothetical protein